jgi:hypothetical protein
MGQQDSGLPLQSVEAVLNFVYFIFCLSFSILMNAVKLAQLRRVWGGNSMGGRRHDVWSCAWLFVTG